jgi:hypothetical protein
MTLPFLFDEPRKKDGNPGGGWMAPRGGKIGGHGGNLGSKDVLG